MSDENAGKSTEGEHPPPRSERRWIAPVLVASAGGIVGMIAVISLWPSLQETWKRTCPEYAWYEGGTLSEATGAEWRNATDRNRLATAADWAALFVKGAGVSPEPRDRLFPLAFALRRCGDAAAPAISDPDVTMAAAGVACILTQEDLFKRLLSHLTNEQ